MSKFRAPLLACRLFSPTAASACATDSVPWTQCAPLLHLYTSSASMQAQFCSRTSAQHGIGSAARCLSSSAVQQQAAQQAQQQSAGAEKGLAATQQEYDEITDKHIPQRPMTAVEGASYSLVTVAGLAVAGAILWAAANELLIQPKEYTCFNLALEKIREDPRVTVRLGTPISAYGQESRNRAARQRIPHRAYTDADGVEHHQIQFHAKGPSGNAAVVNASMYQDSAKQWQYDMLFLDFGGPVRSRVYLIGQGS